MKKTLAVITLILTLTGCGILSGEVYVGTRRIDEVQQTQVMKDKPFKCLFVNCQDSWGGAANVK